MSNRLKWAATFLALFSAAIRPWDTQAAEATLPDGRRLTGQLLVRQQHLTFLPAKEDAAMLLSQVQRVDLPGTPPLPMRGGLVHHVVLSGGERLTGELLELDGEKLFLRTSWADRLSIPRAAVLGVTQPTGWLTLFAEDFESGLGSWQLVGAPKLSDRQPLSGKHSLCLNAAGQMAELRLSGPVAAGRVGVSFHDAQGQGGPEGFVELEFRDKAGPWLLRVAVGGGRHYRVTAPPLPGGVAVARTVGWHRLQVEWAGGLLLVSVDDVLLSGGRVRGTDGPLQKVRLGYGRGGAGEVCFDDVTLARALVALRREPADLTQDEVWLAAGDQLLGVVGRADRRGMEVQGRFGKRVLSWAQVRGIFPRRGEVLRPRTEGEQVRVRFFPGYGADADELEGSLVRLDERHLTLRHALLGEVRLERAQLLQVRAGVGE